MNITRLPIRFVLLALICLGFIGSPAKAAAQDEKRPMNVLLLVADDLNSWLLEDPNRYQGRVIAPNLRRLANSGVNFVRAYTAAPVCSPSRTAFFSGVAPWKSGHYHNTPGASISQPLSQAISMAGLFKTNGYRTACFGKITHGWDQKEYWDVKIGHKRDPAPPGAPLTAVGKGEQDWGPIHLSENEMNDTRNADAAIAELALAHDKPFFLAFGTFNPHMPWYVPQKYFDMFPLEEVAEPTTLEDDLNDVPPLARELNTGKSKFVDAVLRNGMHREAVQAYLATTAYVDAQLGRVLSALESSEHSENTIVVFLTDHGFHLAEKHHWQKATLWEEATHSLLMVRVPGLTPTGQVSQRFVSLLDVYPTLVELCGLERPADIDGRSLLPLLRQPHAKWQSTAITGLTSKRGPWASYISIRNELGRYTRYGGDQEEFYDTTQDPREWTNQIKNPKFSSSIRKMRTLIPNMTTAAIPLPAILADQ